MRTAILFSLFIIVPFEWTFFHCLSKDTASEVLLKENCYHQLTLRGKRNDRLFEVATSNVS